MAEFKDTVTTLHVSNLPTDLKERELFLLYGTMDGFMSGQVKHTLGKTMGFVVFRTRAHAAAALERTNNLSWKGNPPEFTLRVVFAQKQTRNPRDDRTVVANVQPHMDFTAVQLPPQVRGGAVWMPPTTSKSAALLQYPGATGAGYPQMQLTANSQHQQQQQQQQQASATLFVGNVSGNLTDDQLGREFKPMPAKVVRQGTKAWVSFERPEEARNAMNTYIESSVHIPKEQRLRVSFARSDTRSRAVNPIEAA